MEWQPIETAPMDGTWIRVTRRRGRSEFKPLNTASIFKWDEQRKCWLQKVYGEWHRHFFSPTHWLPFAEPPK